MPEGQKGHSPLLWQELNHDAVRREDHAMVEEASVLADIYEGKLPGEYDKYFPQNSPKHVINLIRNAWDDLATSVGRWPDLRMDALNASDAEEERVGLLERIANGYLRRAEPTGKQFMLGLAWWLVGAGRAVALVRPGYDAEGQPMPIITLRDPRHAMPRMRMVGNMPVEVYDIMFKYEIPTRTAIEMGLAEDKDAPGKFGAGPYSGDDLKTDVIEFIDDNQWVIVSEEGYFERIEHGLGLCPGWVFQSFSPNTSYGMSLFKDQVSLQVAVSQLTSLKLAAADRNVNPIYWARGHMGSIKIGANQLLKLGNSGEVGVLAPPTIPQVDRDVEQLVQFSRVLNKNPEVRQGEVAGKGSYTSAKTLEQLSESIDTVIGRYWDVVSFGLQHILKSCYKMDELNWPDVKKTITTNVRNNNRIDSYTPSRDINGRHYINVDYGFGLGGFQGFLQNLQAMGAGVMPRKSVLESMPGISDVDGALRQMEIEGMDAAVMSSIQSQAAAGQLDILNAAKIREKMAEKGKSLFQAVVEMEENLRDQAETSVGAGGAQALTTPRGLEPIQAEQEVLPPLPPAALV